MSGFAVLGTIIFSRLKQNLLQSRRFIFQTMKKHLTSPHIWFAPVLIIINVGFFGLTDPSKVNSGLLIVGYLLLVVTLFAAFRLFARAISLYGVPQTHANRIMGMFGGILSLCLALSSVGELSMRDLVVIIPLAVLLYIYLFYAKAAKA